MNCPVPLAGSCAKHDITIRMGHKTPYDMACVLCIIERWYETLGHEPLKNTNILNVLEQSYKVKLIV